jgi:dTDP-glucose 4,6-dehydratase
MRILITGAAGFVGSNLTDRFLADGHSVVGVDNFVTGNPDNLGHLKAHPDFDFVQHDCAEPLKYSGPLDWIMHFASPASPPKYLKVPLETLRVNAEGSRHLLDLARNKEAGFFLASTSEIYGDPLVHPQNERYWGNVNPIGPRSIYDEAKRYAEAIAVAYHQTYKLPIRIIRIFNTYGPRMDPNDGRVVTNFISQALTGKALTIYGNGLHTRSFQYVDDLVEGIVRLIRVGYHSPVNLGNPEEYTILQLAALINELTGNQSELVFKDLPQDDPKQRQPDISLAKQLLGWEPKVPVRRGLMDTIKYFKQKLEAVK